MGGDKKGSNEKKRKKHGTTMGRPPEFQRRAKDWARGGLQFLGSSSEKRKRNREFTAKTVTNLTGLRCGIRIPA